MRTILSAAMLIATAMSVVADSAEAQLQWQSSGVRQASHTVARPTAPKPARRAKAPTAQAPLVQPTFAVERPSAPAAPQAAVVPAEAMTAPALRYDGEVALACHDCGEHAGEHGEVYYDETLSCGPEGCAVGCGEVTCGLTCGEPCGCGDVGCCGECGMGCGDVCGCGDTCGMQSLGGCSKRGAIPLILYVPPIQELTVFGGVHAFKNPLDAGRDRGNFGIHEGLNLGGRMSWLPWTNLGYQVGYQATHNQLHGSDVGATSDSHTQQFFTAGLFQRRPVGLQYGIVYDFLRDERVLSADFGQVRGLISITNPCGHEFGFTFTSRTNTNNLGGVDYRAVNQYLLFYRKQGPQGGEVRLFGGVDDDSKGIIGGEVMAPLSNRWSLETGFTYLIPEEDMAGAGSQQEAWNIGTNLVWHYGKRAKRCFKGQFRPMFGVADNGSLIIDSAL